MTKSGFKDRIFVLKSGTRDFSCHVVYGKSHFLFKSLFTKHVFEIHETKKSSNGFRFFAKCASGYVVAGNTAELRVAAN